MSGIDETHVCICEFILQENAFDFFEMHTKRPRNSFNLNVPMPFFNKLLNVARPNELVCLKYDASIEKLQLEVLFMNPHSGLGLAEPPAKKVKKETDGVKDEPGLEEDAAAVPEGNRISQFNVLLIDMLVLYGAYKYRTKKMMFSH